MGEVRKWVNKGVGDKRTKINEEKKIMFVQMTDFSCGKEEPMQLQILWMA